MGAGIALALGGCIDAGIGLDLGQVMSLYIGLDLGECMDLGRTWTGLTVWVWISVWVCALWRRVETKDTGPTYSAKTPVSLLTGNKWEDGWNSCV